MNEFASLLLLIAAVSGPAGHGRAAETPGLSAPSQADQLSQLGRLCVTQFGSCVVTPRPMNTQCACGTVRGTIR